MSLRKLFSNIGEDDVNRLNNENECIVSGFGGEREKMQIERSKIDFVNENIKRGRQQKPKIHTKRRIALNRCVAPIDCEDYLQAGGGWYEFFAEMTEPCEYKDVKTCHLCAGCLEATI